MTHAVPVSFRDESELDEFLSRPSHPLLDAAPTLDGGVLILGIGGKMGHTLGRMARRALDGAEVSASVIGVSRFTDPRVERALQRDGIETVSCDLLDARAVARLPELPNVVFMVGRKFGSSGDEATTWAINAYLPGVVADRFHDSRILVFSTGNVYPFVSVLSAGATEQASPRPVGEYAQSCLGRERVFEHFSRVHGTKTALVRLNYAIDLRYGVLLDIAEAVWQGRPIDLGMSYVNVIWQGDACDIVLRSFALAASPPEILNVTGPETASVRALAESFGKRLGRAPRFVGDEAETALLSDCAKANRLLGRPPIDVERMVEWVADWVRAGGRTLGKPTHFEERKGSF